MEVMEQARPRTEEVTAKAEKIEFPPRCIRSRQPVKEDKTFWAG